MRLQQCEDHSNGNSVNLADFSKWILRVGDGEQFAKVRDDVDEAQWIKIPDEIYVHETDDPIQTIFHSTYPHFASKKFDPCFLTSRAILTPKNDVVENINSFIMNLIPNNEKEYMSYDVIDKSNDRADNSDMLYPIEFLNSLKFAGIPNHRLGLKVGVSIMLLQNINPSQGMCNGTRLIVEQLGKRIIKATIISGSHIGDNVMVPRIILMASEGKVPFVLRRRKFPVKVCFAMTINKSQGQTLENVGLYLPEPVFSHSQLYVAVSRVKHPDGLKILCVENTDEYKGWTKNVVFKEIFNKLQ